MFGGRNTTTKTFRMPGGGFTFSTSFSTGGFNSPRQRRTQEPQYINDSSSSDDGIMIRKNKKNKKTKKESRRQESHENIRNDRETTR